MKIYVAACVAALAGLLVAGVPAEAQTCLSTCNTANDKCSSAGKDNTVCLNAWHQCRIGCSASKAAPAKLQISRPSPNTVVIKTVAPTKK